MTADTGPITVTRSEAETTQLARDLARRLRPGSFVLLYGELGAGKTAFVRGIAEGLGGDPDEVSSPTFTLVQRYAGPVTLWHVDLYRVGSVAEVLDLALDDLAHQAVVAVEWAERLPDVPPSAVLVRIDDLGEDRRRISITRDAAPAADRA